MFSCLTFNQLHVRVFIPFLSITGCHTAPQKGGMEVLAGLLSMEQHCQGKRGHPAGQNVSVAATQHPLLTLLDGERNILGEYVYLFSCLNFVAALSCICVVKMKLPPSAS